MIRIVNWLPPTATNWWEIDFFALELSLNIITIWHTLPSYLSSAPAGRIFCPCLSFFSFSFAMLRRLETAVSKNIYYSQMRHSDMMYPILQSFLNYSLPRMTVNTRENLWNVFVSWPIRCEVKRQKIMDKMQQGSVTTWYEKTSWLFLLQFTSKF